MRTVTESPRSDSAVRNPKAPVELLSFADGSPFYGNAVRIWHNETQAERFRVNIAVGLSGI